MPSLNLPLPDRLGPFDAGRLRDRGERLLDTSDALKLRELRLAQVDQLLRRHRDVLEPDPRGEPVVRREILAWSPSAAMMAAALAAGFAVVREQALEGIGETMVVLRVPDGMGTAAALEQLRTLDPAGTYDFNHLYTGSGSEPAASAHGAPGAAADPPARGQAVKIGLVDSGIDAAHAVFRDAQVRRWGCNNAAHPSAHGTAVAALMVGQAPPFRGVAPGAQLYAADVYCAAPTGGSADKIAGALSWLAREQVGVINLSLVGPPNATLERVVGAMVKRGHLVVAAVGNDGPAAPPLYPASYQGVVGVTGVDKRGRPLPEAARGPQVMFAAPGKDMVSASPGAPPYRIVRGTSFAAPVVAAMLAPSLRRPEPAAAKAALSALAKAAAREDANTVSNETGHGVVGATYRNDPARFR
ncbi:S8 family serine peptidase [Massilia cavernae]|uniref:S8 family serine peptidase n=1 Tax=Massilia cavernae TaxID=2320864 RepID=UPI001E635C2F|nr:S8 family serine peptidase [Massilia cavernae]